MAQEQQALLKAYLADETKRYQDWYQGLNSVKGDTSTVKFSSQPFLVPTRQRGNMA